MTGMQAKIKASVLSLPKTLWGKSHPTIPAITEGIKINNIILVKGISPSCVPQRIMLQNLERQISAAFDIKADMTSTLDHFRPQQQRR
jgi:hypothetical protein